MNLNDMKKQELIDYAETLGLDIGSRDSVDEIKRKIAGVTGDKVEPTGKAMEGELQKAGDDKEKELTVIFHPGANGDTSNVYFGINGKAMSLPRNEEVKVKKKYLDMLTNECVGFEVIQTVNKRTGEMETKTVKKPVYTFDILG